MDLESTQLSLRNYRTVFPKTDFIVGIRHPVLWFESFYNFRIHNEFKMPPAERLVGKCRKGWWNVCTFRANFHLFLANLGKTNITTDPNEIEYIDAEFRTSIDPVPTTNRRVFLYDVSQLSTSSPESLSHGQQRNDDDRAVQFRLDLQDYLKLQKPIDPFIWFKPGRHHTEQQQLEQVNSKKIDICNDTYDKLRSVLMHQSTQASQWICKYFIHAPGVVVSPSKDYFCNTILKSWEHDPCVDRKGGE